MNAHFEEIVQYILGRFDEHITRIEVHLIDENGGKTGPNDKRCNLEARVKGMEPIIASAESDDLHIAVKSAAEKMRGMLDKIMDKRQDH